MLEESEKAFAVPLIIGFLPEGLVRSLALGRVVAHVVAGASGMLNASRCGVISASTIMNPMTDVVMRTIKRALQWLAASLYVEPELRNGTPQMLLRRESLTGKCESCCGNCLHGRWRPDLHLVFCQYRDDCFEPDEACIHYLHE